MLLTAHNWAPTAATGGTHVDLPQDRTRRDLGQRSAPETRAQAHGRPTVHSSRSLLLGRPALTLLFLLSFPFLFFRTGPAGAPSHWEKDAGGVKAKDAPGARPLPTAPGDHNRRRSTGSAEGEDGDDDDNNNGESTRPHHSPHHPPQGNGLTHDTNFVINAQRMEGTRRRRAACAPW